MTAPDVRAAHHAQQAAITADALTSTDTTYAFWSPRKAESGIERATFTRPDEDDDGCADLPIHMDGDCLP